MKSNVDYVICPECSSLNAARWNPHGDRSYDVTCTVCGFEHEHGHYDSNDIVLMFDELPDAHLHCGVDPESIGAILQEAQRIDFDDDEQLIQYLLVNDLAQRPDDDEFKTMQDYGLLS